MYKQFPGGPYKPEDLPKACIAVTLCGAYQIANRLIKPDGKRSRATGHFTRYATRYQCDRARSAEAILDTWSRAAFWELIQRPMETRKERPNEKDWQDGWNAFKKLLPQMSAKPSLIIGLGKQLHDSFFRCLYPRQRAHTQCGLPCVQKFVDDKDGEHAILFLDHPARFALTRDRVTYLARAVEAARTSECAASRRP
jgi:hypothetical protein